MGLRDKDGLSGYGNCGPQKFGFVLLVLFSSCVFFFFNYQYYYILPENADNHLPGN